jgi:hypothetical protein
MSDKGSESTYKREMKRDDETLITGGHCQTVCKIRARTLSETC